MGNAVWAEETAAAVRCRPSAEFGKYAAHIQEHMVKELFTNKTYGEAEWTDYLLLLNRIGKVRGDVRVALFRCKERPESELLFALRNIMEETIGREHTVLGGATIGHRVAILVETRDASAVRSAIDRGRLAFRRYFRQDCGAALSEAVDVGRLWRAYASTERQLADDAEFNADCGVQSAPEEALREERTDGCGVRIAAEMQRHIEAHLTDEKLSLRKLSKEVFFMNVDYLGKLFKQRTGEKFSQYVTRRRIEAAVRLMREREELRVAEVAERVGYGRSPHYFSQAFKKTMGCTPSEYRSRTASGGECTGRTTTCTE
ncbi:helix-turn-helix domain-containing protein [Paenibacillus sp. TRM 82003]|nr:helix-turn-helix domain-containing protein [Paenibacillus sp. TRM 82003]